MSIVYSRPQLSPSELRCSPHTTYYTNFFVLRTAVTINGQAAEFGFSENKQLTLNCRYPSTECVSITFHTISSQVEVVLNKYGVSHISNFWLGEVLFLQVGFSCEHSLRTFLRSRQEMQREVGLLISARQKEGQPSTASASPVSHDFPVEVETDLFLVLPDAQDKTRAVSLENCSSCLALWKESEKFDFGALFRTLKLKPGGATVKGELSVNAMVTELNDVVDWFHLGLCLGVPQSELLTVEADHRGQTNRCRTEMLDWWVKNGEQPTWSAVVRALFGIRMRGLAERIAVKYAVPWDPDSPVSITTDTHPICSTSLPFNHQMSLSTNTHLHFTIAGSQTIPFQLPSNIQQVCNSLKERDEELTRISESLPVAKKRKMAASRKHRQVKKQLTLAQSCKKRIIAERDTAKRQLEMKEVELSSLKLLQERTAENNDYLQVVNANKEEEIAQLKEKLVRVENELCQAREEAQQLREQLQQTNVELAEKSTQVREMEKSRSDLERERSRADMMIVQLCANNQGVKSPLENVTPTELDSLKQAVKEKEGEVRRLSSQLEAKETEKQMLLVQMETQDQQEEQLVQLTAEACELRTSLIEAEDRRVRVEIQLEDLKSKNLVINQPVPQNCKAVGHGLQYGKTNQIALFQVHLTDANGEPCVERQEVRAELKSLVKGRTTQAEVSHQTRSVGSYMVSYRPSIQGRHELSVLVNGVAIAGSPFRVYVQQPSQLMGRPVTVIRGLIRPCRATVTNSGQLIITEHGGRISVFDDQGELQLVHRIDSLERWYSRVKLDLRGIAVDDSGIMYVCDVNAHKLFKVSSTGKVLKSVGGKGSGPRQFLYPDGITLRGSKLYICDCHNHRIQIFSCDLNFINSFGSHGRSEGEFSVPKDVAFDHEGNMYVVETNNDRVQVFSPSGTFLRTFGKHGIGSGELSGPMGIYVDHNTVYTTECDNNRISTFTTLGEFISSFGWRGNEDGKFRKPRGITMNSDGFLFVCDDENHRIQMF